MRKRIFGTECEYAPAFHSRDGARVVGLNGEALLDHLKRLSGLILSSLKQKGYPMAGEFLGNGGRLYIDRGGHPEYATPECMRIEDLVAYEKAGDRIVQELTSLARPLTSGSGAKHRLHILKNNADDYANTYGAHENYLETQRAAENIRQLIPFLVTRQIFAGTGSISTRRAAGTVAYQVSQRADFIKRTFSDRTSTTRGIINTRKREIYREGQNRRLHIIVGDSNMSEIAIGLKVGATVLLLRLLDEGALQDIPELTSPVKALKSISHSWNSRIRLEGRKGRYTAMEVQSIYLDKVHCFYERNGSTPEDVRIIGLWAQILEGLNRLKVTERNWTLEDDPGCLRRKIDWVTKLWLLNRYGGMNTPNVNDRWLKLMDFKYHDLDPDTGLFAQCEALGLVDRMVDDDAVFRAKTCPPENTRARIRGEVIRRTMDKNVDVQIEDWEKINIRAKARTSGVTHPFHQHKGFAKYLKIRLDDPFKALDSSIAEQVDHFVALWN